MISSLEGLPTKAKEAPSPHEVRTSSLDTNPVFHSLGGKQGKNGKHVYNIQNLDITNLDCMAFTSPLSISSYSFTSVSPHDDEAQHGLFEGELSSQTHLQPHIS